ncbi:protein kinase [Nocardioides sp. dk4132]|uniref:serine/threonine-protein kinase n=1 Tax=unclassified Nocardioides TaxID=2615069 RepID=UPI0012980C4C|nr:MULTISPECIES: serine/threonine-protein kinase [unclassified Nocardioides]MQW77747.1 protein kinase [Nocardioides sp. dk4132]QGA07064.1 protein kinase [Nocardioides sp. dk884]
MSELPASRAAAKVGDYTLLAKIGEGGMGVVHLARHDDGHRVALKVMRPHIVGDDEARARLAREVSSLELIRSRWVAEILDADPWAEVPYVATRYVPGLSLHDHVVEEGPITGPDLLWFAAGLAEGVASVHAAGVLHRDIKPSNVLMEGRTPILIDFGLARVADDPRLTHTGWLLGTPGYLAPEILYGDDATAASDLHSWAATVAYAGTGRPPFGRGPAMAIMDRVRRGEHDVSGLPDDLPEDLRGLVEAALDPDPQHRPTLADVLHRLRPRTTRSTAPVPPPPAAEDIHTVPLALASHQAAYQPTDRILEPVEDDWDEDGYDDGWHDDAPPTRVEPARATRMLPREHWDDSPERWDGYAEPVDLVDPVDLVPPRAGFAERARRAVLWSGAATGVGVGVAAYPWLATAVVLVAVWLLRSGSLTASAVGDRRRLRGRRWYDGPQLLLSAPWGLVRSIPSTLVLVLWSAGLAAAAGLICYAFAAAMPATLLVCGTVLGLALSCGPGGDRVRRPLARLVHPAAASGSSWVLAAGALVALVGVLAWQLADAGPSWAPATDRPLSGISDLPGLPWDDNPS